jgi:hypothetical protein
MIMVEVNFDVFGTVRGVGHKSRVREVPQGLKPLSLGAHQPQRLKRCATQKLKRYE